MLLAATPRDAHADKSAVLVSCLSREALLPHLIAARQGPTRAYGLRRDELVTPDFYRVFFRDMEIGELNAEELRFRAARRVV